MKRFLSSIFILSTLNLSAQTQLPFSQEPIVGKRCPDFVFKKVDFYQKKQVSLNDFGGKWLILDFWSRDCSGCINSFPKISAEQKEFKNNIQFLMVTYEDNEHQHRQLFANYHKKLHLDMPSAYVDSSLFERWKIRLLPHLIIIDPQGIVKAVTYITPAEKLHQLLDGKEPRFMPLFDTGSDTSVRFKYNRKLPLLVFGNGGIDTNFLFRSLLSKWTPESPRFFAEAIMGYRGNFRFEQIGVPLEFLYRAAFSGKSYIEFGDSVLYGKFWPNVIFDVKDSSLLRYDFGTAQNLYCYSLIVPPSKADQSFMMKIMQADLQNYFGYQVNIETRLMPYWRVVSTDKAKTILRSKGGEEARNETRAWQEILYKNYPINGFISEVEYFAGVSKNGSPVIDETGIEGNIDITVDWFRNDLDSVRSALKKNGLDLVQGQKEMKVIVISDAK